MVLDDTWNRCGQSSSDYLVKCGIRAHTRVTGCYMSWEEHSQEPTVVYQKWMSEVHADDNIKNRYVNWYCV